MNLRFEDIGNKLFRPYYNDHPIPLLLEADQVQRAKEHICKCDIPEPSDDTLQVDIGYYIVVGACRIAMRTNTQE
jgi:hypothetical protein